MESAAWPRSTGGCDSWPNASGPQRSWIRPPEEKTTAAQGSLERALPQLRVGRYHVDVQAIGACAQNILLAAHSLGLGACWIGRVRDEQVERVLEAKEHEELMMLIPIGYPKESPPPRDRKPLAELVRRI